MAPDQPWVHQHVLGGDPLPGLLPQEAPDEALGAGGEGIRQGEVAAADLGKQPAVLGTVEGVPAGVTLDWKNLVFVFLNLIFFMFEEMRLRTNLPTSMV